MFSAVESHVLASGLRAVAIQSNFVLSFPVAEQSITGSSSGIPRATKGAVKVADQSRSGLRFSLITFSHNMGGKTWRLRAAGPLKIYLQTYVNYPRWWKEEEMSST